MVPRPTRARALLVALLLLASTVLIAASRSSLRAELEHALVDGVVPDELVVTYDAMHPFHGGTIVEVHGDGLALRTTRRRGDLQATVRQVELESEELILLVALLVHIEAWEQRVPERPPVPDEGRAALRVEIGGLEGGFWEWYNDMGEHDRLLRVSALLGDLVPR